MNTEQKEEIIELVIRQTDKTRDEVVNSLELHNYNYMKVIKILIGIEEKKPSEKIVSVNQQIYKEIRSVMDEASAYYRFNQEQKQKMKQTETDNQ